jgi:hypothetical protein
MRRNLSKNEENKYKSFVFNDLAHPIHQSHSDNSVAIVTHDVDDERRPD